MLWQAGDLFWIELTNNIDNIDNISVRLPNFEELENKFLTQISLSQLWKILKKIKNNYSDVLADANISNEKFKKSVDYFDENPLTENWLKTLSVESLNTINPNEYLCLYRISAPQAVNFFTELNKNNNISDILQYVHTYQSWFIRLINRLHKNPLTDLWLEKRKQDQQPLASVDPESVALYGMNMAQAMNFFTALLDFNDGIKQTFTYVTKHDVWFKTFVDGVGENPLAEALLQQPLSPDTSKQLLLLDNDQHNLLLRQCSAEQAVNFLSAMDAEGSIDAVLDCAKNNKKWLQKLAERSGKNLLAEVLLKQPPSPEKIKQLLMRLNRNQHELLFYQCSAEQAVNFFTALWDLDDGIKHAFAYATNYNNWWFKRLARNVGTNPLAELLLKQPLSQDEITQLMLLNGDQRDLLLYQCSAEQAANFFTALSGLDDGINKVFTYVANHNAWFSELVDRIGTNPLAEQLLKQPPSLDKMQQLLRLNSDQHTQLLYRCSAEQSANFFTAMDAKGSFEAALAYADTNKPWFERLVLRRKINPLTEAWLEKLPPERLRAIIPDNNLFLYGISAAQAKNFFSAMDADDSIEAALAYANTNKPWFEKLVDRLKINPLTEAGLGKLPPERLSAIIPDKNLFLHGISAAQAENFFTAMDADGSIEAALAYVSLNNTNKIWFKNLVKNLGENPMRGALMNRRPSPEALAQLSHPELLLYKCSAEQVMEFFSAMDVDGSISQALAYAHRHESEFKKLVDRLKGRNPLWTIKKRRNPDLTAGPTDSLIHEFRSGLTGMSQ